jgi:hypothetical protein
MKTKRFIKDLKRYYRDIDDLVKDLGIKGSDLCK